MDSIDENMMPIDLYGAGTAGPLTARPSPKGGRSSALPRAPL